MHKLNAGLRLPLYYQLKQDLLTRINSEEFPDKKLPAEGQLCEEYGVSRMTVRQALAELERDGYIIKMRGKGTFVVRRRFHSACDRVISLTKQLALAGYEPSVRLLSCEKTAPPADAVRMGFPEGEGLCCHIRRVRLADSAPIMIEDNYVPLSEFPGIDEVDFSVCHLYDVMHERYGVDPEAWHSYYSAVLLDEEECRHLEVQPATQALRVEQFTYVGTQIVEYAVSTARTDYYRPHIWVGTPR